MSRLLASQLKKPSEAVSEQLLHRQVAAYLRYQYPGVMFRTDYAAGQYKASIYHRRMHKEMQSTRAWPDVFIAEPCATEFGDYHGLFLELKREGVRIYKKDGSVVANQHYQEQDRVLEFLRLKGYRAEFAIGLDQAKQIIDEYLGGPKVEQDEAF